MNQFTNKIYTGARQLKYKHLVIFIMAGALLNNLTHGVSNYMSIGNTNPIVAILAVITLDLIVLAYAVRKTDKSIYFALVIFVINLLYYDVIGTAYAMYITTDPIEFNELLTMLIGQLLWSGVYAFSIHEFSKILLEERNKEQSEAAEVDRLNQEAEELRSQLEAANKLNESLQVTIVDKQQLVDNKQKELDRATHTTKNDALANEQLHQKIKAKEARIKELEEPLTCRGCGDVSTTSHQRGGHEGKCLEYKEKFKSNQAA